MLIPFPIFIPMFPYVQFKEVSIFEGKTVYEKHSMGDDGELQDWQKELVKINKALLLDNRVPINKVRFVFQPSFTFDVDKNIINPKYDVMLPINGSNGKVNEKAPLIEIGKPSKFISVNVISYKVDDNYEFIKHMVKKAKRGVAIFIVDEMVTNLKGVKERYHSSVDSNIIRMINLDDAIEYYKFDTVDNG